MSSHPKPTSSFKAALNNKFTQRISQYIFTFGLAYFVIWLSIYAITIITTPVPVEYREGAILLTTGYLLKGMNPYSLANQPLSINVYGFGYNLVVIPFAALFGNTLAIHRIVSIICLVLSGVIVGRWLIWRGTSTLFALSGGLLVLAGLLFYTTPIARPDALGIFLFLTAIYLPERYHYHRKSLIISSVLSILAFYTKPYFILSLGIIATYLFLFISKKKGLLYLGVTILLGLIIAIPVRLLFECYFLDTIINNISLAGRNTHFMVMQLIFFTLAYLPFGLIVLIAYPNHSSERNNPTHESTYPPKTPGKHLMVWDIDKPFIPFLFDFSWFSFIISTLAFILILGQHQNNYLTYMFQIMTPFGVVAILQHLRSNNSFSVFAIALVLINLFIFCRWILYPNDWRPYQAHWDRMEKAIKGSKKVLNSPALAAVLLQMGKPIFDSGESEFFYLTKPYPKTIIAPDFYLVKQREIEYSAMIEKDIASKKFDQIIITEDKTTIFTRANIMQNYIYQQTIPLDMPQTGQMWNVDVWIPKK